MEQYFNAIFENVRHEQSLISLLSLGEPYILRQSKFIDHEVSIIKDSALQKVFRPTQS